MMFTYVYLSQNKTVFRTMNTKYIFDNIESETETVTSTIIEESWTSRNAEDRLNDYFQYVRNYGFEHNVNATAYVIFGLPYSNSMNITVANYMDEGITGLNITLSSDTWSGYQYFSNISGQSATTKEILSAPSYFQVSYTFNNDIPKVSAFNTSKRSFAAFFVKVERDEVTLQNTGLS